MIGIYRIVNTATGCTYIGSSVDVARRLKSHKDCLMKNKHYNSHLQSSFIKHGERVFTFEYLIECSAEALARREQEFIDAYFHNGMSLYNQKPSAESQCGFRQKFSEQHRAKIGKSSSGRIHSAETRAKISAAVKGKPAVNKGMKISDSLRQKISRALQGKRFSLEHRAKIGLANKMRSPDLIAKITATRIANGYHHHSEETKAKISKAAKLRGSGNWKHSPETIEKLRVLNLGRKHTAETIEKLRARVFSPEHRQKIRDAAARRKGQSCLAL